MTRYSFKLAVLSRRPGRLGADARYPMQEVVEAVAGIAGVWALAILAIRYGMKSEDKKLAAMSPEEREDYEVSRQW